MERPPYVIMGDGNELDAKLVSSQIAKGYPLLQVMDCTCPVPGCRRVVIKIVNAMLTNGETTTVMVPLTEEELRSFAKAIIAIPPRRR